MDYVRTYVTQGFLENLYKSINESISTILDNENNTPIIDLYRLIHFKSEAVIDIEKDKLIEISKQNPNFKKLWKNEGPKPISSPDAFNKMVNPDFYQDKTCDFFFLNKTVKECKELESDFGFVFISKDDLNNLSIKYLDQHPTDRIFENENLITSWDFLSKYKHPCNAIILSDKYLLKDTINIDNNLKPILNALLPIKNLKNSFHLTIFSKEVFNLDQRIEVLRDLISSIRPELTNIEISVVKFSRLPHDRDLLTNYCWIYSGAGFSIFNLNNTPTQTSNVTFQPLAPNCMSIYKMKKILKAKQNSTPEFIGTEKQIAGSKKNRLLDQLE